MAFREAALAPCARGHRISVSTVTSMRMTTAFRRCHGGAAVPPGPMHGQSVRHRAAGHHRQHALVGGQGHTLGC
jgi:hypothetical protein